MIHRFHTCLPSSSSTVVASEEKNNNATLSCPFGDYFSGKVVGLLSWVGELFVRGEGLRHDERVLEAGILAKDATKCPALI